MQSGLDAASMEAGRLLNAAYLLYTGGMNEDERADFDAFLWSPDLSAGDLPEDAPETEADDWTPSWWGDDDGVRLADYGLAPQGGDD